VDNKCASKELLLLALPFFVLLLSLIVPYLVLFDFVTISIYVEISTIS
jgi:hypothetical protein